MNCSVNETTHIHILAILIPLLIGRLMILFNAGLLKFLVIYHLRVEWKLISIGCNPVSLLARSRPFNGICNATPLMLAVGFYHTRSHHLETVVLSWTRRSITPDGWNSIMRFQLVVHVIPAPFGIVVDKDTAVPAAIQALGSAMPTLGRLIKEHVPGRQNDFMSVAIIV